MTDTNRVCSPLNQFGITRVYLEYHNHKICCDTDLCYSSKVVVIQYNTTCYNINLQNFYVYVMVLNLLMVPRMMKLMNMMKNENEADNDDHTDHDVHDDNHNKLIFRNKHCFFESAH